MASIGGTCVIGFMHGSSSPEVSGLNKHVNFGVYLFLTGVREVIEPSDTSTAVGFTTGHYLTIVDFQIVLNLRAE